MLTRSASLIFCIITCLAVEAATRPKSLGVISSSIVSPTLILETFFFASAKVILTILLASAFSSSSTSSSIFSSI
jgi:hypothetical protein